MTTNTRYNGWTVRHGPNHDTAHCTIFESALGFRVFGEWFKDLPSAQRHAWDTVETVEQDYADECRMCRVWSIGIL